MSQKLYEENSIQDIANAIRSQNGTNNPYTVAQMGNAIRAIKTQPNLEILNATENKTYTPSPGKDGFSIVEVDVDQEGREPVIEPLEITENGIYKPPSGVDGYGPVTVEIEAPSGIIPSLVTADNFYFQDVNPLNAFGNHADNWWGSASAGTHCLSIKFYEPKEISQVKFHNTYTISNYHWCSGRITFQGSDDGTSWIDLFDADNLTDDVDAEYTETIQNSNKYEYYRFVCYPFARSWTGIGRVQLTIDESPSVIVPSLPHSDLTKILANAYPGNYTIGNTTWDTLEVGNTDYIAKNLNSIDITNGAYARLDLSELNHSCVAYFVGASYDYGIDWPRIISFAYSYSTNNEVTLDSSRNILYFAHYGNVIAQTTYKGIHRFACAIRIDGTNKLSSCFINGARLAEPASFVNSGQYCTFGCSLPNQYYSALSINYIGIVDGIEDDSTIISNLQYLMNLYGIE